MLRIIEDKDEIVVQEIPIAKWVTSFVTLNLLFFIICLLLTSNLESNLKILWLSAVILGVAVVFFLTLINSAITIRINRESKLLLVSKQNVLKKNYNVYSFNEIADLIYVNETKASREGINYQLKLPLKNGQNIELSASISSREGQFFKAADLMNSYIYDSPEQIPLKLTVFND